MSGIQKGPPLAQITFLTSNDSLPPALPFPHAAIHHFSCAEPSSVSTAARLRTIKTEYSRRPLAPFYGGALGWFAGIMQMKCGVSGSHVLRRIQNSYWPTNYGSSVPAYVAQISYDIQKYYQASSITLNPKP